MAPGKTRIGLYFENTDGSSVIPVGQATGKGLPVDVGTAAITVTVADQVGINTVTANDLTKATSLKLYELTMNTIGSWLALTLTSQSKGITIDSRANTTTADPPDFDFAFTSTGSPFNRVLSRGSYWEDNIILPTNTILYFNVSSQTNSTIQVGSKE